MVFHTHEQKIADLLNDKVNIINVNDILKNNLFYNTKLNRYRKIYVIDIYRTPIERKISDFFQNICDFHFNNTEENISTYSIDRLIKRFNDIYPYFNNDDYFNDKYDLNFKIEKFDFDKKYILYVQNDVTYIKLRLSDSNEWSTILTEILGTSITITNDYKTLNKNIGAKYEEFKSQYKIPENYYNVLINNKQLSIYLTENERNNYLEYWGNKIFNMHIPFSDNDYGIYKLICSENKYYNSNNFDIHYSDDGCICNDCSSKRAQLNTKINHPYNDLYNNKILLIFFINEEIYETIINLVNLF